MNCLRCGRETEDDHCFCDSCLKTMEKYPVRPGTAVMLPRRKETVAAKKPRHRQPPTPKEQIRRLKRQRNALWAALLLCLLTLTAALILSRHMAGKGLRPGQNYSAVENMT